MAAMCSHVQIKTSFYVLKNVAVRNEEGKMSERENVGAETGNRNDVLMIKNR